MKIKTVTPILQVIDFIAIDRRMKFIKSFYVDYRNILNYLYILGVMWDAFVPNNVIN